MTVSAMASSREALGETRYSPRRGRRERIFALPLRFAGAVDQSFELLLAAGTQRRHDRRGSGDACRWRNTMTEIPDRKTP
ncbi:hypothetical protein [Sinorhizobium fredii]|uniref:Uncharacterized protein n=1 Tax=Rhizobium fredii TaxID=380 RepID=A0A844A5I8_RHIFR|nr:hypothetical protein [Sinorhizobium fredii]MCG5474188.1 hypothetical protein [Sinorhizobium fredii]MQW98081.1 hypothetical protein [Sinorhizobium fredii]MQX07135.1 hypothetical protein [Sinorhizobium fredii]UTY47204.1 hypothetical protein EPK84_10580 [Sinorhizobium fredii]